MTVQQWRDMWLPLDLVHISELLSCSFFLSLCSTLYLIPCLLSLCCNTFTAMTTVRAREGVHAPVVVSQPISRCQGAGGLQMVVIPLWQRQEKRDWERSRQRTRERGGGERKDKWSVWGTEGDHERERKRDSKEASLVTTVAILLTLKLHSAWGDILYRETHGVKRHQKAVLYNCNPTFQSELVFPPLGHTLLLYFRSIHLPLREMFAVKSETDKYSKWMSLGILKEVTACLCYVVTYVGKIICHIWLLLKEDRTSRREY